MGEEETLFIAIINSNTCSRKILQTFIVLWTYESLWKIYYSLTALDFILMFFMLLTNLIYINSLFTWNKVINRFSKIKFLYYGWYDVK